MDNGKIKIIYILPSLSSGGAERVTLDLIYNLDREIFIPELLLFNGGGFFYQEALSHGLKVIVFKKKFKFDIFNLFKIYKYIKNSQPDIVHTGLGGDIYGKLAAKMAKVRVIVSTEHNVAVNDTVIIHHLKRLTAKWSNKIVAISESVKEDILKEYKILSEKVELIYNGLYIDNFRKEENQNKIKKESDTIIIGSVGRLTEQKNFSLLLRALDQVKNRNFKCLIVGEGELRSQLEQEIKDLDLSNKVELLGTTSDINSFLNKLDLFVLPSKWEGLGITLLEAGLVKLPVLASDTGGIVDIIKHKENGLLFNNNDLSDLTDMLNGCLDFNNREYLLKLGEKLSYNVKERFDIRKTSRQYQDMYKKLVQ
jgi:glycosyltransferase involved in cell wall biosynthesis